MIASLRGELIEVGSAHLVVEVGGVGYLLYCTPAVLMELPAIGESVFFHVHTNVREDAIDLYGFANPREKEMFVLLIGISGVGPRLALNILAGIGPADFSRAITGKDIARLTRLQGVGKKTAERLCIELKDKVEFIPVSEVPMAPGPVPPAGEQRVADVVSALVNLGYSPADAGRAIDLIAGKCSEEEFSDLSIEEMLRESLRALA